MRLRMTTLRKNLNVANRFLAVFFLLIISGGILYESRGFGSTQKVSEVEAFSAPDLALSILRDNYDVWADILARKIYVEATARISSVDDELSEFLRKEEVLDQNLRSRLLDLAYRGPSDQVALRAATFLAFRATSLERRDHLNRAFQLSQRLNPKSSMNIQFATVYLAHLLSLNEVSEASKVSKKLTDMLELPWAVRSPESCLALAMIGDIYFIESDFDSSDQSYRRSAECQAEVGSQGVLLPSHLFVRRAWASFRRAKFSETLSHLEVAASAAGSDSLSVNSRMVSDLSIVLAVSLSEVGGSRPASVWSQLSQRHPWVAGGLAKAIKYLIQNDKTSAAVSWSETLEPILSKSIVADEFYGSAIDAMGKSGLIEQQLEFKAKAILALQVNSVYAKSLSISGTRDLKRSELVVQWSKDFIQERRTTSLKRNQLTVYVQIVHAFLSEPVDVCSSLETVLGAYRGLTDALLISESNKVLDAVLQCKISHQQMQSFVIARNQMHQTMWKNGGNEKTLWNRFFLQLMKDLVDYPRFNELRRIAFETLNDISDLSMTSDSERLISFLYSTMSEDAEFRQFERDALTNAVVRLISKLPLDEQFLIVGRLLLRDIRSEVSISSLPRRQLEMALAASAVHRGLLKKNAGDTAAAVEFSSEIADEISVESDVGRDLLFIAARLSCEGGLHEKCVTLSMRIADSAVFPDHDRYLASQWLGHVFWSMGRYGSAAQVWMQAAEFALSSGRREHILESSQLLVRAGHVFAELKMWADGLRVRDLLMRSVSSGVSQGLVLRAVIDWSVAALSVQAYDVAQLMSTEISEMSKSTKKSSREVANLKNVTSFIENLARVKAKNLAIGSIEESLLLLVSDKNASNTIMSLGRKTYERSSVIIQSTLAQWRDTLISNASLVSEGRVTSDFRVAINLLLNSFASLTNGCRVAAQSSLIKLGSEFSCVKSTSETFFGFQEKLKARVLIAALDSSDQKRALLGEVLNLEIKFRNGMLNLGQKRVRPEYQFQTGVLERKVDFLSTVFEERR